MKNLFRFLLIAIIVDCRIQPAFSQCTPAAPTIGVCSGGNGPVTNGANVNSGIYYFTGGPTTFSSGINLNGGTVRVCGNLILANLNFNSGNIIVESGGSLTINAGFNMNGSSGITNRGTLTISGSMTLQNTTNTIWNDNSVAYMSVSGTITLLSSTSKIVNKGTILAGGLAIQNSATVCMQDNAIFNVGSLSNNVTNSVSWGGSLTTACIGVSGSASLNNALTSSNKINVCLSSGSSVSGGGGWGSAVVSNNCPGCNIILPLTITSFNAFQDNNKIKLQWSTAGNYDGYETFYAETSDDGDHFYTIATIGGADHVNEYEAFDYSTRGPQQYYRIREVSNSGRVLYSPILVVKTGVSGKLAIYPNPVSMQGKIHVIYNSKTRENIQWSLLDMSGKLIFSKMTPVTSGVNQLDMLTNNIPAGNYVIKVQSPTNGNLYSNFSVIAR